ncbi:MAG TPA: twin-arginine translocase subunit TatC, partial [Pirellulaceae bacterium]
MPRPRNDDDRFAASTMSFGEHLEELRWAFLRASLGFLVAMAVAFPFADDAVRFVEGPLSRSLRRYYRQEALDELWSKSDGVPELGDWQLMT